jgi:hypothetical protein
MRKDLFWFTVSEFSVHGHLPFYFGSVVRPNSVVGSLCKTKLLTLWWLGGSEGGREERERERK